MTTNVLIGGYDNLGEEGSEAAARAESVLKLI